MCPCDLTAIKFARLRLSLRRKIVHEDLTVNFGSMHRSAPFHQQISLFRRPLAQQVELLSHERLLFLLADSPLDTHQVFAPPLDLADGKLLVPPLRVRTLLVGVRESSHPI